MKRLLLISMVALTVFGMGGCKKKDNTNSNNNNNNNTGPAPLVVKEENKAVLFDFSETWCPPCGSYGGPGFDGALDEMEGTKICAMKVYGSSTPSTMNGAFSKSMATAFGVTGVPSFYCNTTPLSPTGGVYSSKDANVNWVRVQAGNFQSLPVNAAVALDKSISGNVMTVRTKTKFYADFAANQDYRLAIFVVEDKIIAKQATTSGSIDNYEHRNLYRIANGTDFKGVSINNKEAITTGKEFDKDYTLNLDPSWNQANLKVIAIIWDCSAAGLPKVINSNLVK